MFTVEWGSDASTLSSVDIENLKHRILLAAKDGNCFIMDLSASEFDWCKSSLQNIYFEKIGHRIGKCKVAFAKNQELLDQLIRKLLDQLIRMYPQ